MLDVKEINSFINSEDFNRTTPLCELLSKYSSDKCKLTKIYNGWHNYSTLYDYIFRDIKNQQVNFFEMGIYKGSSIRAFSDYFQNGYIYAGDIDTGTFITGQRIKCYRADQDDTNSIKCLFDNFSIEFDIIIDDGKHEFISNHNMLQNSIHKLKKEGIYIIEDLRFDVVDKFKHILSDIKHTFSLSFIEIFIIDHPTNKIDNNIILIQK
jgi:hypothetical protein